MKTTSYMGLATRMVDRVIWSVLEIGDGRVDEASGRRSILGNGEGGNWELGYEGL
ncbi:MAG: hypothetical protein Q3M24_02105 [Candidatus Electrothrix aestuarii]|uniref:Uncharacterized protein n=1 Tax=Candidatus Electrothrix aestuarii TaxID=3062594 RepID=A0AAU8LWB1_9BACT